MKQTAIVLGGTVAHIELIQNLHLRGYYTVLVDYLPTPPAQKFADKHVQISTLDYHEVLNIAKKSSAKLVISTSVDQANIIACQVAEALGLTKPYSSEIAKTIGNKKSMKEVLFNLGIRTANYTILNGGVDFVSTLKYPLVVKPVDGNGSKGVRLVYSENENKIYFIEALEASRIKEIIVEEYIEGNELSINAFVIDSKIEIFLIVQKHVIITDNEVSSTVCSISPYPINDQVLAEIKEIGSRLSIGFGFNNCPLLMQFILNGDDLFLIEFAARIGGGPGQRMIKRYLGIDLIAASVDSYLNLPIQFDEMGKFEGFISTNHLYYNEGTLFGFEGYEDLIEEGIIDEIYFHKQKNYRIGRGITSSDRVASFISSAKTLTELRMKVKKALKDLRCMDINGREIQLKPIYDLSCLGD